MKRHTTKIWINNRIDTLRTCLIQSPHSFVGEIGLDKGRHKASYQSHQIPIFVQQMSLAAELNRPVSIHSVKTDSALIDLFDGMDKLPPALTLHSYCGSLETWKRIVAVIEQKSIQQKSKCELFIGLNCVTNLCKKDLSTFSVSHTLSPSFNGRIELGDM